MRALLSPVFIIVAAIGALALAATLRRHRRLAAAAWALFAFAFIASAPITVNVGVRLLETHEPDECNAAKGASILVVLMGGASGSARSAQEIWTLQEASVRRLLRVVELAGTAPGSRILISGGGKVRVPEARIGAEFVQRMGWPQARLDVEDRSADRFASAIEVAQLLRKRGAASPLVLVTSALHMPRAAMVFRKAGLDVWTCPVDSVYVPPELPGGLLPQITALRKFSAVWHELAGLAAYGVRLRLSDSGGGR